MTCLKSDNFQNGKCKCIKIVHCNEMCRTSIVYIVLLFDHYTLHVVHVCGCWNRHQGNKFFLLAI